MKSIDDALGRAFELFDQGDLDEAENLYIDCLAKINDQDSDAYNSALHGLGYVKSFLGEYAEARNIYSELLQKAGQREDKQNEAVYFHQLGMVERMAENYPEAERFFDQEWHIYKSFLPDFDLGFAANLYEQGYISFKQGNFVKARHIMQQSLDFSLKADDLVSIGCSCRGLGKIFHSLGDQKASAKYFEQAIAAFEKGNDLTAVEEVKNMMEQGG